MMGPSMRKKFRRRVKRCCWSLGVSPGALVTLSKRSMMLVREVLMVRNLQWVILPALLRVVAMVASRCSVFLLISARSRPLGR